MGTFNNPVSSRGVTTAIPPLQALLSAWSLKASPRSKRPRSDLADIPKNRNMPTGAKAFKNYYPRERTFHGMAHGTNNHGPHFVPISGKAGALYRAQQKNPGYALSEAPPGTILTQRPAQMARTLKLMNKALLKHAAKFPHLGIKPVSLNTQSNMIARYVRDYDLWTSSKDPAVREVAHRRMMELDPTSTYSHGKPATKLELARKPGETRNISGREFRKAANVKSRGPLPETAIRDRNAYGNDPKIQRAFLRAWGVINKGSMNIPKYPHNADHKHLALLRAIGRVRMATKRKITNGKL